MATKPLTNEAIELTEKKMDMSLDEIIKLSKNKTAKPKNQRTSNKSNNSGNSFSRDKYAKAQKFMDTRSTMRQGALAQRRSSFQRNQFPLAADAARKAASVPILNKPFGAGNMNKMRVGVSVPNRAVRNGSFNMKGPVSNGSRQFKPQSAAQPKQKPQTLDSLFANMKEERMRIMSRQNGNGQNAAVRLGNTQNNSGRRIGNGQNNSGRRNGNGQNNSGRRNGNGQNNAGRWNGNGHNNAGRGNGNGQNNSGRRNGNGQQFPPWQRSHFGQ